MSGGEGGKTALPHWTTDELILALDLYFHAPEAQSKKDHPEIVALSNLLRRLPLFPDLAEKEPRFRNPQGVYMKLMNFRSIDPDHPGRGLAAGGISDAEVFERFQDRRDELHRLAALIRSSAGGAAAPQGAAVPTDDEDEAGHAEGRITYRLHRTRERSRHAAGKAKATMRKRLGRLECEVCGVAESTYASRYDIDGGDLFECHHRIPLADLAAVRETRPKDLAVLCPTCHRAIHRLDPLPSVEGLRIVVDGEVSAI